MNLQAKAIRTRMIGGAPLCAYDLYVPVNQFPADVAGKFSYFIVIGSERFVTLSDALRPADMDAMPKGFARYDAFKAHEAKWVEIERSALIAVFPELANGHGRYTDADLPSAQFAVTL